MRIQTAGNEYKTVKKEKYNHTLSGGGAVSPISTFTQWTGSRESTCMPETKYEYPLLLAIKPSCVTTRDAQGVSFKIAQAYLIYKKSTKKKPLLCILDLV